MPRHRGLLEVAHTCQNDDPWDDSSLYSFCCDGVQIGFVTPAVWEVLREQGPAQNWPLVLHTAQHAVTFTDACCSVEQRTHAMNAIAEWMRDQRLFPDPLDGGITAGEGPLVTVVRECEEEAGLSPSLVRSHIQAAGVLTYFYKTESGWRQPEMQYVYDLPLPADVTLAPSDGEAESFELLDRATIMERMLQGTFKPNCTLVLMDFFIRHGWLTADNESDYTALASLLHTPLRIPVP
ncbi:thiamine diphosphokinase [Malassezia equina]|uniref:Thiamine diphosphokinase n=1 Tax=Malassezia equina TaxID=1381935 RepID=A0AAF0EB30_9BASI|nr:thiamine diphosphokinase [Malassezia equina]